MMLMALSMEQLHLLAQNDQNEVQYEFFGHVMTLVLVLTSHDDDSIKMAPLYSLNQDNQNEMQYDFLVI